MVYLRSIGKIRKLLSRSDAEKLVHAFVTSRLDSCNSLLAGLPFKDCIQKLQDEQNSAARIVMRKRRYDHITPVLSELHWLPVRQRIDFKILVLTYKCMYGLAPDYLSELLSWYVPRRPLRSVDRFLLKDDCPKNAKEQYTKRAFRYFAPKLWNSLPEIIRSSQSLECFKSRVKTHLFKQVFFESF